LEALGGGQGGAAGGPWAQRLADLGDGRLTAMDHDGLDVQVLSLSAPGVQNLPADQAPTLARDANDLIAAMVGDHPDRYQGFATLPTTDSDAAVAELRRCVTELGFCGAMLNGRTGERNIDHPDFGGLWATAADLRVPVYLHPTPPAAAVQRDCYSGFGEPFDSMLATYGLGWHFETGLQLIRLIYSGVFDRHPELQVIVGHWGEMVLFFAERIASLDGTRTERPLMEYLRGNVFYTGSGINSERYLRWALEVVGADRVMFSSDYPFVWTGEEGGSRRFLQEAVLSEEDREKIAHGNWEGLIGSRA
jgi:predicted TIM-barrel fold metal-dependent hydrolase